MALISLIKHDKTTATSLQQNCPVILHPNAQSYPTVSEPHHNLVAGKTTQQDLKKLRVIKMVYPNVNDPNGVPSYMAPFTLTHASQHFQDNWGDDAKVMFSDLGRTWLRVPRLCPIRSSCCVFHINMLLQQRSFSRCDLQRYHLGQNDLDHDMSLWLQDHWCFANRFTWCQGTTSWPFCTLTLPEPRSVMVLMAPGFKMPLFNISCGQILLHIARKKCLFHVSYQQRSIPDPTGKPHGHLPGRRICSPSPTVPLQRSAWHLAAPEVRPNHHRQSVARW